MLAVAVAAIVVGLSPPGVHAAGDSVVVFNEIMYHPATNEAALEWVELHNQMAVDVDISGWRIRSGISYDFPPDTILPGGGYAVIARDPSAVAAAHGITGVFGPFDGRLSNGGETLRLRNHDGRTMDELAYDDQGDWPVAPDGSGVSLSKIDQDMGTADPENWSWSLALNGTPGSANTVYRPGLSPALAFNEVAGATNTNFWIELHNAAPTNVAAGGYRVAGTGINAGSYALPAQTIPPGGFLALNGTTLGFRPYDENKLFLYGPSGTAVVDATVAKSSPRARCPDGTGDWLRSDLATPGASNAVTLAGDVVINEIMYHHQPGSGPYAESDEEWIELYNRGTQTVDLFDWRLAEAISFTFPSNTFLAAGGFLVVAKDTNTFFLAFPAATNVIGDYSGRLANGGERIVLRDAAGNPADEVRYYDGHPWPEFADGGGSSLELRDPDADNALPRAWAASDESSRSTWQTVTYRGTATEDGIGHNIWHEFCLCLLGAGELLLDDVSVIEEPDGSAIEFMQNGDFESDAVDAVPAAWRLLGTHGSHGRSIVVDDPDVPGNRALHLVSTGDYKHEHNHGETTFSGGQQVVAGREYEISFRAKWLSGSPQINTRLYFNWLQRTTVLDVPRTHGTPGRANSRLVANAGPTYDGLAHSPVVPGAGQTVQVSIEARDPDAVQSLWVMYAVNGGGWQSNRMANAVGDHYAGTIPGQSASARVQFYVLGRDGQGAVSTWPAAGRDSRAMYRVQDGLADLGTVHNFRMIMTTADRDAMYPAAEHMSNYRRGGTVVYDERLAYYDVGIRFKGSPAGRSHDAGRGFNIQFPADRPFRGVHHTVSIERGGSMREVLAKHMFSEAGGGLASLYDDVAHIITPRSSDTGKALLSMARYTDVFLDSWLENGSEGNDVNYELLYTPTTTVDGNVQSLKKTQPYTHTSGAPDFDDYGEDKETYRWNFQLRNNRRRDDYASVIDLGQALSLTGDALDVAARDVLDVSQWMRTFGMQSLVGNDDTYTRLWRHNFRMIQRPSDDRMLAMPWDLDRTFRLSLSAPLWGGDNAQNLIELAGSRRLYYGHLLDMINTTCNTAYMAHWTSHYGALLGENFSGILSWIGGRSAYVLGQLPSDRATFTVTNAGAVVASDAIVIGGQAGIAIRDIRLQGQSTLLETWWTSSGSGVNQTFFWQATVPLAPGTNALVLEAVGFQDEPVGTVGARIVSTVSERPIHDYLRVTEVMYNPADDGDREFIELHNRGPVALDLGPVQVAGGVTFAFAGKAVTNLPAGAYVLVVRDLDAFAVAHNTNGLLIAGEYGGGLANGGEQVTILGAYGAEIVSFEYDDGREWPLAADGAGHALVPLSLDGQDTGSLDYGRHWRAGTYRHGSPGRADPVLPASVLLNEIMAHTDYTNGPPWQDSNDWIELYNRRASTVSLADWYLSDDAADLRKWAIPSTNTLAANDWMTFREVTHFHTNETSGFGLNKDGEQVFLSHLSGTTNDRVVDAVAFGGQENGLSFGRYGDGGYYWHRLSPTTNAANRLPGGDIVIDEIMFNAARDGEPENPTNEFAELLNPLGVAVPLWNASGTWRVNGGIDFAFPVATSLAPGQRAVLVSFDPTNTAALALFRDAYDVPGGAALFGPFAGRLANGGERVSLERPQASDDPLHPEDISWVVVDEATYFDRPPWPVEADGTGRPLQRLRNAGSGNDPDAWIAGLAGTPGAAPNKLWVASPADGQGFLAPFEAIASVEIQPEFVAGAIRRVALLIDDVETASTNAAPFVFPFGGIFTPGTNTLRALLVDDTGTNLSAAVVIRVYTHAPSGDAGRDRFANVNVNGTVTLGGMLDANGFPPGEITTTWALEDGPGLVQFADLHDLGTDATFSVPGTYTLALTTGYGGLARSDFVTVTVVDTNTPNRIPYAESFESYAVGQQLGGVQGWTAIRGEAVVATNAVPHGHAGSHPLLEAGHAQSLAIRGDVANELAETAAHSNVWVDVMLECVPHSEGTPSLPQEGVQFAAQVDASRRLAVWNGVDTGGSVINGWTVLPDVDLGTHRWMRLTVNMDYAAEPDRYRLWVDALPVTNPRTWFISGKTNDNSLTRVRGTGAYLLDDLVVDDYDVLNYRKVAASATGKGAVTPDGEVLVPIGGDTNVHFAASNYYHVASLTVDGTTVGTNTPALTVSFTNILSRRRVEGEFGPNLTPTHGVPEWWLAGMDPAWTNDFETRAEGDADRDGMPTWEEFVAGTHPTSGVDAFALAIELSNGVPVVAFEAIAAGTEHAGRERYYSLEATSGLGTGMWAGVPGYTNTLGMGQTVVYTNALSSAAYRAGVWLQ